MVENKSSLFGIIAIIIGASGLGIGAYSIVNFQTVEGPQGLPGEDGTDGTDGEDAPGGLVVGILDPDHSEIISGNVTIRALIYGTEGYSVSVLRNGTEIGTLLPLEWNTTAELDGWWNITVIITDTNSSEKAYDEVLVYVENNPLIQPTIRARAYVSSSQSWSTPMVWDTVWFNQKAYDTAGAFNTGGDGWVNSYYVIPEDGYYFFTTTIKFATSAGSWYEVIVFKNTEFEDPDTDNAAHITQGFGSVAAGSFYTLTITDIKWFSQYTEITVYIYSNVVVDIDGGPDETFFVIEKLPD